MAIEQVYGEREMTESSLVELGVLEFINGLDFRGGTQLRVGVEIAVGCHSLELRAKRILGKASGVVVDRRLEPGEWRAQRVGG